MLNYLGSRGSIPCRLVSSGMEKTRSSPSPLELFNREGQRRRGIRHAAELNHEVCRGRSVRGLEDHDRIRFAEEAEKLVDHHVVRELGGVEQSGCLLPQAGEVHKVHQGW